MKLSFSALCLLFPCLVHSQNLLDTEFEKYQCFPPGMMAPEQALPALQDNCFLMNWQYLGQAQPQLIDYEGETLVHINWGKEERADGRTRTYKEYLQATFPDTLEQGIWYRFSAEIKAHSDATVGINDMDIYFGSAPVNGPPSPYQELNLVPQTTRKDVLTPYNQLDYFNEWIPVEKYYRAEGQETFLILARFGPLDGYFVNISRKVLNWRTGNFINMSYLIRNIKLEKIPPPRNFTNEIPATISSGDRITLNNIQFATGESIVMEASYPDLRTLADRLIGSQTTIEIIGHTDSIGDAEDNQELSEERARQVAFLLMDFGIPESRIRVSGKGERDPLVDNSTPEGRAQNRRVEFKIYN